MVSVEITVPTKTKMKFTVLLLALAALVAVTGSSAIKSTRANLIAGSVLAGDRQLSRSYVYRPAAANAIQYEDVIYRGNATTRISAVQAIEVGASQMANPQIIAGGLGASNVTVRFTSARGRGYYYDLIIYGR